jgi:hypothetical protein
MLNNNQINSLKNIYQLFSNIFDIASAWINEINENDIINDHIEKLSIIMRLISDIKEDIEGDLDDILIIVEENLKEFILQKYSKDNANEIDSESDHEFNNY